MENSEICTRPYLRGCLVARSLARLVCASFWLAAFSPASAREVQLLVPQQLDGPTESFLAALTGAASARAADITFTQFRAGPNTDAAALVLAGRVQLALIRASQVPGYRRDPKSLPVTTLLSFPSILRDSREQIHVEDSALGGAVSAELGRKGFVVLGFWNALPSSLVARSTVRTQADWKGMRVRTREPASTSYLSTLGAQAVLPTAGDETAALKIGLLDASEVRAEQNIVSYFDAVKGGSLVSNYKQEQGFLVANENTWVGLRQVERVAIQEAVAEARQQGRTALLQAEQQLPQLAARHNLKLARFTNTMAEGELARGEWLKAVGSEGMATLKVLDEVLRQQKAPPKPTSSVTPGFHPKIFFATNRNDDGTNVPLSQRFGVQRDPSAALSCGEVSYTPDASRKFGEAHSATIGLATGTATTGPGPCSAIFAAAAAQSGGEILVFVHGYHNSFDFAVRRAIAFAQDLNIPSPVVVFSWPSMDAASGYLYDLGSVTFSKPYVRNFITALHAAPGVSRVSLLAHSMGSQIAFQALEYAAGGNKFPEVLVFVAPDVPRTLFVQGMQLYGGSVKLTTLYANQYDRALFVSSEANKQAAAGAGGSDLLLMNGVETVDVSEVDRQLLEVNHSHGFDVPKVAGDVSLLLKQRLRAAARNLPSAFRSNTRYWRILP